MSSSQIFIGFYFFPYGLCWGKVMVAYIKPQQRKKKESEKLRGEEDEIKFIDLRFERERVVSLACLLF